MQRMATGPFLREMEDGFFLDDISENWFERVYSLEVASYPEEEAATREKLTTRCTEAPEHFKCLKKLGDPSGTPSLAGFVVGTRSSSERLTHDSMAKHERQGTNLCIHSVVVDSKHRRAGLGVQMLKLYIDAERLQRQETGVKKISLIAKTHLVPFYQRAGFTVLGPSPVAHGVDPWIELFLDLQS